MNEKPVVWLGDSRETIRAFSEDVRAVAGFQLWRVQRGLEPNDWKPMPSVGLGVQEIRIRTEGSIECCTLRSSRKQSTSCTRSRSERGGRQPKLSTSRSSGFAR